MQSWPAAAAAARCIPGFRHRHWVQLWLWWEFHFGTCHWFQCFNVLTGLLALVNCPKRNRNNSHDYEKSNPKSTQCRCIPVLVLITSLDRMRGHSLCLHIYSADMWPDKDLERGWRDGKCWRGKGKDKLGKHCHGLQRGKGEGGNMGQGIWPTARSLTPSLAGYPAAAAPGYSCTLASVEGGGRRGCEKITFPVVGCTEPGKTGRSATLRHPLRQTYRPNSGQATTYTLLLTTAQTPPFSSSSSSAPMHVSQSVSQRSISKFFKFTANICHLLLRRRQASKERRAARRCLSQGKGTCDIVASSARVFEAWR